MKKSILITAVSLTLVVGYYLPVPQIRTPIDSVINRLKGTTEQVETKFLKENSCAIQITGTIEEKPKCLTDSK